MRDATAPRPPGLLQPSQVSVKTVLTVCLTVTAFLGCLAFVRSAPFSLGLTVVAALLAVPLQHLVVVLTRRGHGRMTAIAGVMLASVGFLVGLGLLVIPSAVAQSTSLVQEAPGLVQRVAHSRAYLRLDAAVHLSERLSKLSGEAFSVGAAQSLLGVLQGLANAVFAVFTVYFFVLFMLIYGPELVRRAIAEARPENRARYERIAGNLYQSLGRYVGGLLIICSINATCTSVLLAILGVPFFLPLGLLSGLGSLVPLVGAVVAGALITLVALVTRGPWVAVAVLGYYVAYQQVENHVLVPVIYKRSVKLNPLLILVGVVFFAELLGVVGAVVAVPALTVLHVGALELVSARRERMGLTPAHPDDIQVRPSPPPNLQQGEGRGPAAPH